MLLVGLEASDIAFCRCGLVPEGPVGDLGVGDCDKDAAADVAGEVDESGDLVALRWACPHTPRW